MRRNASSKSSPPIAPLLISSHSRKLVNAEGPIARGAGVPHPPTAVLRVVVVVVVVVVRWIYMWIENVESWIRKVSASLEVEPNN